MPPVRSNEELFSTEIMLLINFYLYSLNIAARNLFKLIVENSKVFHYSLEPTLGTQNV
jgi:hypothetical protein